MATLEEVFQNIVFRNEQHKAFTSVVYVASVAEKHLESVLEPHKITAQQYRVLRALRRAFPEGIRVYTLREFLIDAKSDISRLVDRMQKAGYVKKQSFKHDKRITHVVITPKGMKLMSEVEKHEDEFYRPVDRISQEQAKELNELLEVMFMAITS